MLLSLGLKRFRTNAPLVTHCSAAISASCHPPDDDPYAAFKPLTWGEVIQPGDTVRDGEWTDCDVSGEQAGSQTSDLLELAPMQTRYAHCSLTSKEIRSPRSDQLYC